MSPLRKNQIGAQVKINQFIQLSQRTQLIKKMAKTDRDTNYMKETFGTESLITDYGPTPSLPTPPETLDSILRELEEILSKEYAGWYDSFDSGRYHLAEKLYPTLKTLQNKQ